MMALFLTVMPQILLFIFPENYPRMLKRQCQSWKRCRGFSFMVSLFVVSQILAGLAFLLDMVSFQLKKREQVLLPLVFSAALLSVHFFLLDQITASLIVFLSAVRMFLARKFVSEKVMMIFLLLNTIVLLVTFEHPVNILAFLATTFITYANFRKDDRS